MNHSTEAHPVLRTVAAIDASLKDVADVDPAFMRTEDKRTALLRLSELSSRLDELKLRVLGSARDVAEQTGARDAAAWLSSAARLDRPATRGEARLGEALERRWAAVGAAVRDGAVNPDQAAVIVRALEDLPEEVDRDVRRQAESRLVELAGEFGPRQLRILGRRILDVVTPEMAEEHERKALERERTNALRRTFLTSRRNGDGTTDLKIRISDLAADRLLTYLSAFTSPRRTPKPGEPVHDLRRYDQRLGHAFVAFLESVDPRRMPLHGGDATTVIVTIDHQQLVSGLGTALVATRRSPPGRHGASPAPPASFPPSSVELPKSSTWAGCAGCTRRPSARPWRSATGAAAPRAATSRPPGVRHTMPGFPGPRAGGPTSPTACCPAPGTTIGPTTAAMTLDAFPPATSASPGARRSPTPP